MNILHCSSDKICGHDATFIIVDAHDDNENKKEVLNFLKDDGWISSFSDVLKECYQERLNSTVNAFLARMTMIQSTNGDGLRSFIGEKVVTVFSAKAIEEKLGYHALPLAEVIKEQVSNNPGYDFYNENTNVFYLVFGEGKYESNGNPYNVALKQINEFELDKKSLKELGTLQGIANNNSINNYPTKHSFSAGFSYRNTEYLTIDTLIEHIKENAEFLNLIKDHDVVAVGVEMNGL